MVLSDDNVINCFSSTMDMMKPEVNGFLGFFDAYTKLLSKVELYGPANLSESLENLIKFISSEKFDDKEQFYVIAVFIVTSRITDLIHSIKLINKSSNYPCSIIILGIGYEFHLINDSGYEEYNFINKLMLEDTYDEIKNKYDMIVNERPIRRNSIFIDFYSLFIEHDQQLRKESVHKPILRKLFKEISQQFLDFVRYKDIPPLDYKNLNKKTHAHFLEFKKDKLNEDYSVPHFLLVEKQNIEEKLRSIGFTQEDLFKYVNIMPSFEMHYLLSCLNFHKYIKHKQPYENYALNFKNKRKKMLIINGISVIDERDELRKYKEKEYFEEKVHKKILKEQAYKNNLKDYIKYNEAKYLKRKDNDESFDNQLNLLPAAGNQIGNKKGFRRANVINLKNKKKNIDKEVLGIFDRSFIEKIKDNINELEEREHLSDFENNVLDRNNFQEKDWKDIMIKYNLTKDDLIINTKDPDFLIDEYFFDPKRLKNKLNHIPVTKFSTDICNICNEKEINICFTPCKHMYICEFCVNFQDERCSICSRPIRKCVKIYKKQKPKY